MPWRYSKVALAEKEIVLDITNARELNHLIEDAKSMGIRRVISRNATNDEELDGMTRIIVPNSKSGNENTAVWLEINSVKDVQSAIESSGHGHAFVVVQCNNWKIIPLENLIAEFQRMKRKLYAYMTTKSDIELAFTILEKGVDGVVIPAKLIDTARQLILQLQESSNFPLTKATITAITDVGVGERVCIDTASQLSIGEGLLVGSKSSFFFLVHSETIKSEYIPTRPFRVNAGAIHSYVLGQDNKTRYISEIKSGDKVQIVSINGSSRSVIVGRAKIERRPLVMIVARVEQLEGSILLQKAETIRLVRSDHTPVPVTELKEGEEVLVHLGGSTGRHFGGEVDEFIVER
jgi:3-dehydroquinate synthase II